MLLNSFYNFIFEYIQFIIKNICKVFLLNLLNTTLNLNFINNISLQIYLVNVDIFIFLCNGINIIVLI